MTAGVWQALTTGHPGLTMSFSDIERPISAVRYRGGHVNDNPGLKEKHHRHGELVLFHKPKIGFLSTDT